MGARASRESAHPARSLGPARPCGRGAAAVLAALVSVFACAGGGAPPPEILGVWIHVRSGRQCELTPERKAAILEEERARLDAHGVRPRALHVAAALEALPVACRSEPSALAARASQRGRPEVAALLTGMACAACGCPEPWFVCLRAEEPEAADPASLGYLRIPGPGGGP